MNQRLTGKDLIPGHALSSVLHVNDRIQLQIDGKSYPSRIEDVDSNHVVVAAPISKGKILNVRPGRGVTLGVIFREAMHEFQCTVSEQISGRVPTIVVTGLHHLTESDRRTYPRTRETVKVLFRMDKGVGPWEESITDDLGGGGLRVARKDGTRLSASDVVDVRILLPGRQPINTVCRVLRVSCTPSIAGPCGYWAAEFTHIYPKDRTDIAEFVAQTSEAPRMEMPFAR